MAKRIMAKRIPIRKGAYIGPRKDGEWREDCLGGSVTLPAGTELVHVSVFGELEAFAPEVTCFAPWPVLFGSVYILRVLEPIPAVEYDVDDIRIDLAHVGRRVEIVYAGEAECDPEYVLVYRGTTNRVKVATRYVLDPEFADRAREWGERSRRSIRETAIIWSRKYGILEGEEARATFAR